MEYTINGVCYVQTPLVLGQVVQLSNVLSTLEGGMETLQDFINVAGDRLPELLAIVLTPKGTLKKDKSIADISAQMEEHATLEVMEAVISDFFVCNPNIPSLLEKIDMATGIFGSLVGRMMLKFASSSYASFLQGEISPEEMTSSGATDSTK